MFSTLFVKKRVTHEMLASNFVNKVESLAEQYQQKAEVIGASFESEMAIQIGMLNERITSLNNNVDYLNSSFEIDAHLEKLSELNIQQPLSSIYS